MRFQIFFACLVAFLFSGCSMIVPVERLAETELEYLCNHRYLIDNAEIMLDSFIVNKKNIDVELKKRGKDCGCYYQAWSKSHLYMGLLGAALKANASKHCESDDPKATQESTLPTK